MPNLPQRRRRRQQQQQQEEDQDKAQEQVPVVGRRRNNKKDDDDDDDDRIKNLSRHRNRRQPSLPPPPPRASRKSNVRTRAGFRFSHIYQGHEAWGFGTNQGGFGNVRTHEGFHSRSARLANLNRNDSVRQQTAALLVPNKSRTNRRLARALEILRREP